MPALPQRPCVYPGCPRLVAGGRCAEHQQAAAAVPRGKTAARGYGSRHKRLKILCHERDRWRCVDCGWEPESVRLFRIAGKGVPPTEKVLNDLHRAYARNERHLHADHEIPIEKRPDLADVLANYRTRCDHCHNRKTASEDGGFGHV